MPDRWDDIINKHASRVGIDPTWMKAIMRVESGGDPNNATGSYHGLFQLSHNEFGRHGGFGNIYDPEQNTMAAANKLSQEAREFQDKHGRAPKLIDLYMVHQQGAAGYSAHLADPEGIAWENVRKYYGSDSVAKAAIWGNLPASQKQRLGSVENVKSKDLVNAWDDSIKGGGAEYGGTAMAAKTTTSPKTSWLTGKPLPERKPSLIGGDEPIPQPRIDLQVPQFTPRFTTA